MNGTELAYYVGMRCLSAVLLSIVISACGSDDAFDPWGNSAKGEMWDEFGDWLTTDRVPFSDYVLKAEARINRSAVQDYESVGGNYGVTTDVYYQDQVMVSPFHNAKGELTCHCVGTVFEVMMLAFQQWDKDTNGNGMLGNLSYREVKDKFRHEVYMYKELPVARRGVAYAITHRNFGHYVPLEAVQAGDFAHFDRHNGTGHTVIVHDLKYNTKKAKHELTYFSCNGGGLGPSVRTEAFGTSGADIKRSSFVAARMELPGSAPVTPTLPSNNTQPAPTVDTTPPTVSITSPSSGFYTNSSMVEVKVLAGDNSRRVAMVEVFVDNELYTGSAHKTDFQLELSNGPHVIYARAIDPSGNNSRSSDVSIIVDVPASPTTPSSADQEKPKVQITSPQPGEQSGGSQTVEVKASDNVKVTKVELMLNGKTVDIRQKEPYQFKVNLPSGRSSTLTAVAHDEAKNKALHSVTVSVPAAATTTDPVKKPEPSTPSEPGKDTDPPEVDIVSPSNDAKLTSGSVTVKIEATDDEEVHRVDLEVNGEYHGSVQSKPYEFTVTLPAGRSTIKAIAVDLVGYRGSAAVEVQVGETKAANQRETPTDTTPKDTAKNTATNKAGDDSETDPKTGLKKPTIDDGCAIGGSSSADAASPLLILLLVALRRRRRR